MTTTPNLDLEILTEGQANKEASITETHQQLDALVQATVIDRDLTAPPGAPGPAEGDVYLVGAGATGAWAGQDGALAHYRNGAWTFIPPREGWRLWVRDENLFIVYDGSNWNQIQGGGSSSVSLAGFQGIWEQIDRREFSASSSETIGSTAVDPTLYDAYRLLVRVGTVSADTALSIWASKDGGTTKVSTTNEIVGVTRSEPTGGHVDFDTTITTVLDTGTIDKDAINQASEFDITMFSPGSSQYKCVLAHSFWNEDSVTKFRIQSRSLLLNEVGHIDSFIIEPDSGMITGSWVLLGLKKSEMAGRIVEDVSIARTLTDDDNNRILYFSGTGSGTTVTIPNYLSPGFMTRIVNDTGASILFSAGGSPSITILGETSVADGDHAEIIMLRSDKATVVVY